MEVRRSGMSDRMPINATTVSLIKGDITDLDIDCFVYYANSDLKLGSGFGGAISGRGGMSIQKELDEMGSIETGQAVISGAGDLKARFIIHANGPKFQEENLEDKLRVTMKNSLELARSKGIKNIAFPPMGTGFYGIPLEMCAAVMLDTLREHLDGDTSIENLVICAGDDREYRPFKTRFDAFQNAGVGSE
jgi:O-acetyl-ADP-ribose deacetylase (regulator of RNase III)